MNIKLAAFAVSVLLIGANAISIKTFAFDTSQSVAARAATLKNPVPAPFDELENAGKFQDDNDSLASSLYQDFKAGLISVPKNKAGCNQEAYQQGFIEGLRGQRWAAPLAYTSTWLQQFPTHPKSTIHPDRQACLKSNDKGCCYKGFLKGNELLAETFLSSDKTPPKNSNDAQCRTDYIWGNSRAEAACKAGTISCMPKPSRFIRYLGCEQLGFASGFSKCPAGFDQYGSIRGEMPSFFASRQDKGVPGEVHTPEACETRVMQVGASPAQ